jgi:hypothetical protein
MRVPTLNGSILAGIAVLALLAGVPRASADSVEDTFLRYHAAIHAAAVCEGRHLEQNSMDDPDASKIAANQERMGAVINGKVMGEIAAGRRLSLIEQAKSDVDATVKSKGCDGDEAKAWLALFHAELEPVIVE